MRWEGDFFSAFFKPLLNSIITLILWVSMLSMAKKIAFRFITIDIENTFSNCGDEGIAIK